MKYKPFQVCIFNLKVTTCSDNKKKSRAVRAKKARRVNLKKAGRAIL